MRKERKTFIHLCTYCMFHVKNSTPSLYIEHKNKTTKRILRELTSVEHLFKTATFLLATSYTNFMILSRIF